MIRIRIWEAWDKTWSSGHAGPMNPGTHSRYGLPSQDPYMIKLLLKHEGGAHEPPPLPEQLLIDDDC